MSAILTFAFGDFSLEADIQLLDQRGNNSTCGLVSIFILRPAQILTNSRVQTLRDRERRQVALRQHFRVLSDDVLPDSKRMSAWPVNSQKGGPQTLD